MQTMSSTDLTQLSPKILKEYINAYHLPAKTAIEKTDLVKIIFNSRPISNENECHYRLNRNKIKSQPQWTTNNDNQQQQQQWQQQQHQQQQQQQRQQRPLQRPTVSKSTPTSNNDLLSIHDLVKGKVEPSTLSVRTLKSILKANFVEQSHVIEKVELVRLVKRLMDQNKQEETTQNEESLCRICYDAQQNCVFLDCGHMVTCMDCAKKLIQTKNECPICREPILKLVHVFRS